MKLKSILKEARARIASKQSQYICDALSAVDLLELNLSSHEADQLLNPVRSYIDRCIGRLFSLTELLLAEAGREAEDAAWNAPDASLDAEYDAMRPLRLRWLDYMIKHCEEPGFFENESALWITHRCLEHAAELGLLD